MAKILVVDDDPRTRQLYTSLLTPFGHRVLEAGDGRDGLNLTQQENPDLILSDILMPTMNGFEFVSALRSLPSFEKTPVIFQSASFLDHQSRALGAQCGVTEFLAKPCEPEKVLAMVNRVLGLPDVPPFLARTSVESADTVSLLVDAFYDKGQELDVVSVRLSALVEFGIQIAKVHEPEALLDITLQAARKIIGANYAGAGLVREHSLEPYCVRMAGMEAATAARIPKPAWTPMVQQIVPGKTILRVVSKNGQIGAFGLPELHPPVRCLLGIPLQSSSQIYGLIYVADKLGQAEFSREDERLLSTIAIRVAIGYESALRERTLQEQMVRLKHEVEQRKQAEERFRRLIETAPTGILICDGHGRITEGNAQLQRMFGYTRAELIGQPIEVLVPEQNRGGHVVHRSSYVTAPQSRPMGLGMELRGRRKDGTTFPVEISLGPVATKDGMLISGTVVDISERKKLELQLQTSHRLEAVGQLAAGIAHDFNNILTAISGNTKLAVSELAADHPVQQNLEEIAKASSRATKLVSQILTFSRHQESKRQVIQLAPVIEEVLKLLRATLPANIAIHSDFASSLPSVSADATQMHQILMNLCTNAADAMPQGGELRVRVESIVVSEDLAHTCPGLHQGSYIRLSLSDQGCGISPSTLEHIFEPFFTTKPHGQGTGLGLSVVHGIVKNHGGAITVYSEPGKGTIFHLYFPAADAAAEPVPVPTPPVVLGQGQRILYVDDEAPLVLLMKRMLEKIGYKVTGCTEPEQAFKLFQSAPWDFGAVISDLSMPGMSGIDLARELLRIRPGLPILIASGFIRPEDNEAVRSLGLPDLLLKPDTVEQLGEALRNIFAEPIASRTHAQIGADSTSRKTTDVPS